MKFSIRDVLWLTVVVGLAVGWGLDRAQLSREHENAHLAELHAKAELASARNEVIRARARAKQLQSTAATTAP